MHFRQTIEETSKDLAFMFPGDVFLATAIYAGIEKSLTLYLPGVKCVLFVGVLFCFLLADFNAPLNKGSSNNTDGWATCKHLDQRHGHRLTVDLCH